MGVNQQLSAYEFLERPKELRKTLEAHGVLTFTPYASGLFPAGDLSPEMRKATGMGMAWLRDNAHVANALYEAGQVDLAVPAGEAMLTILNNNRGILDKAVSSNSDSGIPDERLPVRVQGDSLANDTEKRVQNDSVGYALWYISRLISGGAILPNDQDLSILSQTVRYLDRIQFWQDPDEGHWEEDKKIHASSIGVVIAGLREVEKVFNQKDFKADIDFSRLINQGTETLYSILGQGLTELDEPSEIGESNDINHSEHFPDVIDAETVRQTFDAFDIHKRKHDAALLFLIEPLHVLEGEWAAKVVNDVEEHLRRSIGIIRYPGDTYWEPRFPHIMGIGDRTTGAPGRLEWRNQTAAGIEYTDTEAQWTLFDPILATYWGKRYMISNNSSDREKQLAYLDRSLTQLAPRPDGKLQLPEAYYYEYGKGSNDWIPNDHIPLLWSQANLLTALQVFEASGPSNENGSLT